MEIKYSRQNLSRKERFQERLFEVIPGALSWLSIIVPAVIFFYRPLVGCAVIIAFLVYWIIRLVYMNIFLVLAYFRFSLFKNRDWMEWIQEVDRVFASEDKDIQLTPGKGLKKKLVYRISRDQIKNAVESGSRPPLSKDIIHLVIVPVYSEDKGILEPGIISFYDGQYPSDRIVLVLTVEERAPEEVKNDCRELTEKYKSRFKDFIMMTHPDGVPGEAKVKGANVTFAAKNAKEYFDERSIPYENVIVSCFDADTVVGKDYFSGLTYYYQVTPKRTKASFQPVPVYHNNVWEATGVARVLDVGSSFFQLVEDTNPQKLVTFSSHSMSFKALVEEGYWPVDIISEDSAIFWKSLIWFDADYRVVPLYITLSMDVNEAETLWQTIKNIYKQRRRWAWGAENFPIVMRAFLKNKKISFYKKFIYSFKLLDKSLSWASWPFLLTIVSWLPVLFAHKQFVSTVLYYNFPRIKAVVFLLASTGVLTCILLSILLLPKCKVKFGWIRKFIHIFEWILVPFAMIFLNGVPALDAQTRLMLGKYMEFWTTPKVRKPL